MSFISPAQREMIMDELREFMEQLSIIGWKEQRSWSEFSSSFKVPDSKNLQERVTANFLHYRTNYLIITASVFIVRLVLAPFLFLSIVFCGAASAAAILLIKDPIRVGDYEVNHQMKLALCGVGSFVFLGLCGAVEHLLWGVVFSSLLCCGHMVFRPRNISSRANKAYEEAKIGTSGWFGGAKKEKPEDEEQDPEAPSGGRDQPQHSLGQPGSVRKRASPQGGLY
mmetsp:Transcript_15108/g.28444  ORF Transcript_15108/g.28444 Transcript_15108/m.28444 type:complete len:225 (+) Transcript_15108:65-739(+)